MIRREAIEIITKKASKNPIVSANGYISRDLFEVCDKESNFYMIGSMGLASSIALGVALKKQDARIFVFDGDGNLLMNLGSLTTVGTLKPTNFVHIVFDNELHESTGGQPTHTNKIKLDKIAKATNYKVFKTNSKKKLENLLDKIKDLPGPIMILVKVERSNYVSKRVSLSTSKIRERFEKALMRQ